MTVVSDDIYKNLLESLYDGVYFVDCERRILYWNKGAEKITGFKASEVIGKRCSDNINHVDGSGIHLAVTACPLSETMADSLPREVEVYVHHKNGHRIPVLVRTTLLQDLQGKVIGAVEIFSDNSPKVAITQRIKELEKMALLDPLTELANRRYIEMSIQRRFDEMQRYGLSFGILFMDIDHFKKINDVYGHEIGDNALKMVAKTLLNNVRTSDVVGRWGGEEFVVIVVNVVENKLYSIANKLRALVEQSGLSIKSNVIRVTISVGATLAQPNETLDKLLERADKLLYHSKLSGRNCVSIKLG